MRSRRRVLRLAATALILTLVLVMRSGVWIDAARGLAGMVWVG
jgi:hypothetical protein